MKTTLHLQADTEYEVDVVVVGGGTAGCFAAISAAKKGAKTVLVEKNGILGGTMTVGGVNYPGLFFAWGKQIIAGPCWESIQRTIEMHGATLPQITYHSKEHWKEQIKLNTAIYAHVLDEMSRENGVEVLFHSMPISVEEKQDGVVLFVAGKEKIYCLKSKYIIDATGDGNIVSRMGYPMVQGAVQQPATLTNKLSGYNASTFDGESIYKEIKERLAQGALPYPELNVEKLYSYLKRYILDIHVPCENCADSLTKGKLETEARKKIVTIANFLRTISGLENLHISDVCNECGVRETKRVIGEHTITEEEYLKGVVYPDAVSYAYYPIDVHVLDGVEKVYLKEAIVPTIPFKALVPKDANRVLVCGRLVSSDRAANSALRVEACCMAMGQVAGCATAVLSRTNESIKQLSYEELCESLESIGAIVPTQKDK